MDVSAIDAIASGVHSYWRGAAGKISWGDLKVDMPGQVAVFRAMADRAISSDHMAGWEATSTGITPDAAVSDLAMALYECWCSSPPTGRWTPILEITFLKKAAAAAGALRQAGIGLSRITQ